jgi:hypothetical protein
VTPNCFIVRDANGQALSYVYYESEPGRRSAAKLLTGRIAANNEQDAARLGSQKDCNAVLRPGAGLRGQLGEHNAEGLGGSNYRLRGRLWR